jgi:aspartate/methionine/tyrosine aminotransferase
MEWAKIHQYVDPPGTDLSGSGLEPAEPQDLSLTMEDIKLHGNNVYGMPALKKALAQRYRCKPGNVLVASGASLSNFLVSAALLHPGDVAMVERPTYEPLPRILQALGARVLFFDRRFEEAYRVDVADLDRLTPRRTRLIVISNTFNPSASLLTEEEFRPLGALARRRGAMVLSDEVYLDGVFEKKTTPACMIGKNMITTGSLSKIYGLGHLRVGWAIGPEKLVWRAERIYDHLGVHNPYVADAITLKALQNIEPLRERARRKFTENLPLVQDWMASRSDMKWVEPAGGFMCFPRLPRGVSARKLVALLRSKYDTQVVPGHFFGSDRHIRLGFGMKKEILARGLRNLSKALDVMRHATSLS